MAFNLYLELAGNTSVNLNDGNGRRDIAGPTRITLKKKTGRRKRDALQIRFLGNGGELTIKRKGLGKPICLAESNGTRFTKLKVRGKPKNAFQPGEPKRYKVTKAAAGLRLTKGSWRINLKPR